MPGAIGAAFVSAHDADRPEAHGPVSPDCPLVGGRRIDRDPVMAAFLEQESGERPDGVPAQAAAVGGGRQEQVDLRAAVVRVELLAELDAPHDRAANLDRERVRDVLEPVLDGRLGPALAPPAGDLGLGQDRADPLAISRDERPQDDGRSGQGGQHRISLRRAATVQPFRPGPRAAKAASSETRPARFGYLEWTPPTQRAVSRCDPRPGGTPIPAAISAEGLVKIYRSRKNEVRALDGIDLEVEAGTVLGLLGPNGAGKTTTVRILTTLLRPDAGRATVAGFDVVRQAQEVRSVIGLSGQYAAVDENLTGRENLWMFGRLYQMPSRAARQRANELLDQFGLVEAADRVVKTYSGGMRRRLDLAGSLISHPLLLFLDEPTTGLDPQGRLGMWDVIRGLVREGATLLLTTQYLEEADELADSIAVVDHGRIIARGTADELKSQVGGERIEVVVHDQADLARARQLVARSGIGAAHVDEHTRRVSVATDRGAQGLVQVVRDFDEAAIRINDIGLRRPTLDDVFLTLTGHASETDQAESNG